MTRSITPARFSRRALLVASASAATAAAWPRLVRAAAPEQRPSQMQFGLVTYLWGQDWDLPTLLENCEKTKVLGVELRTQHAHKVEPSLTAAERGEVRKRFADSPVELVGYGSNAQFHEDDPAKVKHNVELTKQYVRLMHDCGGSGVKVKPNGFVKGVPREKTIEQIGKALNQVAQFGADYGQQIRVEVHGRGTSELPVMKAIFDVADHPNVGVCWNSNAQDLEGEGLEHNFALVQKRLAATTHVRELDDEKYPYGKLIQLLDGCGYRGWVLLEARGKPADRVLALQEQRRRFHALLVSNTPPPR